MKKYFCFKKKKKKKMRIPDLPSKEAKLWPLKWCQITHADSGEEFHSNACGIMLIFISTMGLLFCSMPMGLCIEKKSWTN